MATKLYKDGEMAWVPAELVDMHVKSGWEFSNNEYELEKMKSSLETATLDELKEYAQKYKINYWHLMGEDKLREKLANVNED